MSNYPDDLPRPRTFYAIAICKNDGCISLDGIKAENDGDYDDSDRHTWQVTVVAELGIEFIDSGHESCPLCGSHDIEWERE